MLLDQEPAAAEILVLDQTPRHEKSTEFQLNEWEDNGRICWVRLSQPSQPAALNEALTRANQEYVLFLDDDIRVDPGFLAAHHAGFTSEAIWAVAGQVLQPGEEPLVTYQHHGGSGSLKDSDFVFRSNQPTFVENAMSGNMTVRLSRALEVGGFDENFTPPVAYRFDNEFCKRLCKAGGKISFQPSARIYHLRASRGGTRSNSNHLTSISPEHGMGDYYFALVHGRGVERWSYVGYRILREVRTRFHMMHPWWIPIKLIGETRAFLGAFVRWMSGPLLITDDRSRSSR